jgi:hypothetical protein
MKLTAAEIAYVHSVGLYLTERCDGCGKLLNQTFRYTIAGRREVYCSTVCRDTALFSDRHEVKKRATPGKCADCGGRLKGKKRGSIFCDDACRKAHSCKIQRITAAEVEKSRTPAQSNQAVGDVKTVEQGKGISGGHGRSKTAVTRLPQKLGCRIGWGRQSRGVVQAESPVLA